MTTHLEIETVDAESLMVLHQEWISGELPGQEVDFELTCGAGLGSAWVVLTASVDGKRVREAFNFSEVLPKWVDSIVDRVRAEAGVTT